MNHQLAEQTRSLFLQRFAKEPALYFSPGRINLLGEHVDYNDGFVLPAAIDKGVYYAIAANGTSDCNFFSIDFNEAYSTPHSSLTAAGEWKNYVLSVVNQFVKAGKQIQGFDCVLAGDIPRGSGISSSAAVEGGLAFALNELFDAGYNRKELALLCQRAEHDFPNVKCGIMDQFANMHGKKDAVILLDCQSLEHQHFPLQLDGYSIVLINTKVHHSLASSAYNRRRQECEEGLLLMRSDSPVRSFRDVTKWEDLIAYEPTMGEEVFNRCMFVVQEIARTQEAAKLLQQHDLKGFGKLMFQTHEGLSKLYEVSCPELDILVNAVKDNPHVLGARMMGGGFGGCTINIIKKSEVQAIINSVADIYAQQTAHTLKVHQVKIAQGTHIK